ncbi:hypothetical protein [Haloarcula sp. CGMCC 1.2071]|uniref:hypothetical protein n=1 Tax=Haloarcula sp. CGMCC 1.2071 TaxID=3111454 RepID=UPI00300F1A75
MSLLGRNVTGDDILALWNHIARNGPVERETLLKRYYPGDAEDPDQSDFRKTLEDAINFLEEADQVVQKQDGYTLKAECIDATSSRVAILKGLRAQTDEDEAYIGVLDVLTEEDKRYFDIKNELDDLLSKELGSVNWTENKISYWTRTMSMLGVIAPINSDADENYTHLLSLSQDLLLDLLRDSFSPNDPVKLQSVMNELDETYLPVYATTNRDMVASYFETALSQAESNDSIELRQASDFGGAVDIRGSGYNSLTLRVGGY